MRRFKTALISVGDLVLITTNFGYFLWISLLYIFKYILQ